MNGAITFKEVGNTGIMESNSFVFNRNEMLAIFQIHPAIDFDIRPKIINHEHISMELPQNRNIKFHFWVDSVSSDKWIMNITLPVNTELMLPEKIKELLINKKPIG